MNTDDIQPADRNVATNGGYVTLPYTIRDRLHELTGAELKVWLAYVTHANAERGGLAWPGLETLSKETGLYDDYISCVRGSLVDKGWLLRKGIIRKDDGTFSGAPAFVPVIPADLSSTVKSTAPEKHQRRKKSGTGKSTRTVTGKFTAADTGKSPVRSIATEHEDYTEPTIPIRTGVAGWMVAEFSNRTFKPLHIEDDEVSKVEWLVKKCGERNVKDAFVIFLGRDAGFEKVVRPVSLFFKDLPGISESLRVHREWGLDPEGAAVST